MFLRICACVLSDYSSRSRTFCSGRAWQLCLFALLSFYLPLFCVFRATYLRLVTHIFYIKPNPQGFRCFMCKNNIDTRGFSDLMNNFGCQDEWRSKREGALFFILTLFALIFEYNLHSCVTIMLAFLRQAADSRHSCRPVFGACCGVCCRASFETVFDSCACLELAPRRVVSEHL